MSFRSIVVFGPPESALIAHVVRRASIAGIAVTQLAAAPPDRGARDAALDATLASADACVDASIIRSAEHRAWAGSIESSLPAAAPFVICCHAGSATASAAAMKHPERVVGFGLLPPCDDRRTVELARGLRTSDTAFEAASELWRRLGHSPLPVGDGAGLVVARVVACLANEAAFTAMEGVAAPHDIDLAMRLGTGYPRGPLEWCDLVGAREILATLDALAAEHGEDRFRAAPLLRRMAAAGASWEEVHDRR